MNIQTNNKQNFTGTYIVNYQKAVKGTRQAFEDVLGAKSRVIVDNFNGNEKSVLYIVRNSKDKALGDFIVKNDLSFKYIPTLDVTTQSVSLKPKKLLKFIEEQPLIIHTKKKLQKFLTENRMPVTPQVTQKQPKPKAVVESVLKSLHVQMDGQISKTPEGVILMRDKANDGLVKISPTSSKGVSYVYVKPANLYDDVSYYAVEQKSGEVFKFGSSPEDIQTFKKGFQNAVDAHRKLD